MNLLGVDVGDRRIGVAVADTMTGHIRPLTTIVRREATHDAATLRRLAGEQGAVELIVGLPLSAEGTETTQSSLTREWAAAVALDLGLPISWRDERHTSQAAEDRIGRMRRSHSGAPPSPRALRAQRARVDREAAAAILQAELDARTGSVDA
jgi:putative holliday junction resolvase